MIMKYPTELSDKTIIKSVVAGATIVIPTTADLVKIIDDSASAENAISIGSSREGKRMMIYNGDAQTTSGAFKIPSGKTLEIAYINGAWKTLNTY